MGPVATFATTNIFYVIVIMLIANEDCSRCVGLSQKLLYGRPELTPFGVGSS